MATEGYNDGLRFNVTSAGAFILWGSLYSDHPVKRITISPKPGSSDPTSIKETFMHDTGPYGDFQQILYWESGLDRETSYTVDISAVADQQKLAFNELQLLDGYVKPSLENRDAPRLLNGVVVFLVCRGSPFRPSSTPKPAPSAIDGGHRRNLTPGNVAVIVSLHNPHILAHLDRLTISKVITPILFLAAVGAGAFWFRKKYRSCPPRHRQTRTVTPYVNIFKNGTSLFRYFVLHTSKTFIMFDVFAVFSSKSSTFLPTPPSTSTTASQGQLYFIAFALEDDEFKDVRLLGSKTAINGLPAITGDEKLKHKRGVPRDDHDYHLLPYQPISRT
ncbi:hypothetical protein PQX77_016757 [Marasmius sp. AFHP31]|nr:hypothetical protein PQX77_016757 [Marasmius sp. AFHP31]